MIISSFDRKTFFTFVMIFFFPIRVHSTQVEWPSSFNPVGSGARAIGMGGAFIGVADDATAASWNPGGLVQMRKRQYSIVYSSFIRDERNHFPDAINSHKAYHVDHSNINHLSFTFPFEMLNRNMTIAFTYQQLYTLDRNWFLKIPANQGQLNINYLQEGSIDNIGFSYCIQVNPKISFGLTLNYWEDGLMNNDWLQDYTYIFDSTDFRNRYQLIKIEEYSFKGFNSNLGGLITLDSFSLGFVLKLPFRASIHHSFYNETTQFVNDEIIFQNSDLISTKQKLDMPISYGIGIVYKFSDDLYVSSDLYRTQWDDFCLITDGKKKNPISRRPISDSIMKPTHQLRMGLEYLIKKNKDYIIPFRTGIFYDPIPAEGYPDPAYGFSFGLGLTRNQVISVDFAYQYRFANNVGESLFENMDFSQDISEHFFYVSMTLYD